MAERIDSLPVRSRLYPWDDWTDGCAWRIRRGEDYEIPSTSMAQIVRDYARRRSLEVTARVNKQLDAVEFQFATAAVA